MPLSSDGGAASSRNLTPTISQIGVCSLKCYFSVRSTNYPSLWPLNFWSSSPLPEGGHAEVEGEDGDRGVDQAADLRLGRARQTALEHVEPGGKKRSIETFNNGSIFTNPHLVSLSTTMLRNSASTSCPSKYVMGSCIRQGRQVI